MKLSETEYYKPKNFRGYMEVPQNVFDQITPFLMRDPLKMMELVRDMPVDMKKPAWIDELEEGQSVDVWEWHGYIILAEQSASE